MLELIAPAGNLEKLKTAFAFGAEAVYLGLPAFSLRARLNEFTPAKIAYACKYAHQLGKKIYVTVNIFAQNRHFSRLPQHIRHLRQAQVDAVIASDPGVIRIIKKYWPTAKIHLSTQANCLNVSAAKFWSQYVERIILGREVNLNDIKAIHRAVPKLELEYFVHGAMCMAYSGRCFLSQLFTQRSANLGDCAQPCRWPYKLKIIANGQEQEKDLADLRILLQPSQSEQAVELSQGLNEAYFLNSHDLCLLPLLAKLIKAGIRSFKIEGRTKSVYYVAVVVGAYRRALQAIAKKKNINKELAYLAQELAEKLHHRGYTFGFLEPHSQAGQLITASAYTSQWEFCGQVEQVKQKAGYYLLSVKVHNTLRCGEEIEIVQPYYDIIKINLTKMVDKASGQEIVEAHGGRQQKVIIKIKQKVAVYSILRRQLIGK